MPNIRELPELQLRWKEAKSHYDYQCIHSSGSVRQGDCGECTALAFSRIKAADYGFYALSAQQTLPSYGHSAIFHDFLNQTTRIETFKSYCKTELMEIVKILAHNNWADLHPLDIAVQTHLFWGLIHYYGSIRCALSFIVPDIDWDSRFGQAQLPTPLEDLNQGDETQQSFSQFQNSALHGRYFFKCDAKECCLLDVDRSFSRCGNCCRKRYCSRKCQKNDWAAHKKECVKKKNP